VLFEKSSIFLFSSLLFVGIGMKEVEKSESEKDTIKRLLFSIEIKNVFKYHRREERKKRKIPSSLFFHQNHLKTSGCCKKLKNSKEKNLSHPQNNPSEAISLLHSSKIVSIRQFSFLLLRASSSKCL
jgi:hypothetical protein